MNDALLEVLGPELAEAIAQDKKKFYLACREFPSLFIGFVMNVNTSRCHVEIQKFWSEHDDCFLQAHRGLGKSSQMIGRVAWEIGKNPDLRIKIVSNVAPEAQKATKALMALLESPRYKMVFPEIQRSKTEWGTKKLTVQRKTKGLKDPTVEACNIFGHAGGRVDLLIFDDICDLDNSVRQELKRNQVKEAVKNTWIPMTNAVHYPRIWRIGTPYHVDDVVADWTKEAESEELPFLNLKCEGVDKSPWPEMFPPERLRELRGKMGPVAYARAMECVPLSGDETVFREADIVASAGRIPNGRKILKRVAAMDLAFSEKTSSLRRKDERDWSVFAVGDIDETGDLWIVRMIRGRVSSPKWREMVLKECDMFRPEYIKTEEYGPLKGIVQEYREHFGYKGIRIKTRESDYQDKYARATTCQSFVEGGHVHFKTDDNGEILRDLRPMFDEVCEFPLGSYDDAADVFMLLIEEAQKTIIVKNGAATKEVWTPNMLCYADLRKQKEERVEREKDREVQYKYHGGTDEDEMSWSMADTSDHDWM